MQAFKTWIIRLSMNSWGRCSICWSQWVHSTQTARCVVVQDRGSRRTSFPRKVPQQGVLQVPAAIPLEVRQPEPEIRIGGSFALRKAKGRQYFSDISSKIFVFVHKINSKTRRFDAFCRLSLDHNPQFTSSGCLGLHLRLRL
jgi:hypothetical protein